jgi:hypothetical protein
VIFVDIEMSQSGYRVVAEFDNPRLQLRPGMTADMTIYPAEKTD